MEEPRRNEIARDVATRLRETAQLLVSELATNAFLYSGAPFEVAIDPEWAAAVLRVSVTDRSEGEPRVGRPSKFDEHGRGLQLVATLSDRWGVDPSRSGPGKTVWFELRTTAGAVFAESGGLTPAESG